MFLFEQHYMKDGLEWPSETMVTSQSVTDRVYLKV